MGCYCTARIGGTVVSSNYTSSQFIKPKLSYFTIRRYISTVTLILILLLSATNVYSAQVTIVWNPNNESDLAGYKVYYGNSSGSYDGNIDAGNQTSYTLSSLVEGATYYIALTAYDISGNESSYSSELVYNVPDATSPSTPTSLQATIISTSQIDLSWNASTDNVGVTGYRMYRDGIQVADVSSTTYQDMGLSPSTTYTYTVSAYDSAGNESGQSSTTSATTLSLPVNNPPVLSSIGNKSVNEGQTLSFTISATDIDGDTLNYTAGSLPLEASFSESTMIFTWTPTYDQAGIYSNISFQVSDGKDIDSESIAITVVNTNRAPVLDPIAAVTANEGDTITLNPTATDPDGDALTYSYSDWMSSANYTTDNNDAGSHTVTVTVSDGSLIDSQDVMINVIDVDTIAPNPPQGFTLTVQ
jgi:chitodextrinase